ncbi:MAG: hypothetical protein WAO21_13095 [Verrucomicrobiia bacterium]|jgi:hypothetical protein
MDDSLKSKLAADIDKSGFGSEMRAIRVFLAKGWGCYGAQAYFDRDEGKTREIDISAHYSAEKSSKVTLEYMVKAEVKKTERPWIVFRHQDDGEYEGDSWVNPYVKAGIPFNTSMLSPVLAETSPRKKVGWMARSIHEAFKDPNQPSRWYSAFASTCKACEDYIGHDFFSGGYMKMAFKDVSYLTMCNPVIILDGLLVSARLTDKGETQLDEIEYAPFEFDFRSAKYERGGYRVDLVTLKYLHSYLDLCASRANHLAEKIQEFQADEFLEQE